MDTVHVRDRGMLGAPDHEVWRYGQSEGRTICTINYGDFRNLAASEPGGHFGVVAMASGTNPAGQFDMVTAAINWLAGSNTGAGLFLNRYLEVDENGEIIFVEVHYGS
jgi:hypothetical protein